MVKVTVVSPIPTTAVRSPRQVYATDGRTVRGPYERRGANRRLVLVDLEPHGSVAGPGPRRAAGRHLRHVRHQRSRVVDVRVDGEAEGLARGNGVPLTLQRMSRLVTSVTGS